ncbi:MAG: asparagine synthase (glutamine-hydrolyzing) [Bacteroidetes bacterium]|nr:asparagine synthase (glutamine-hydrolyzing) [Bacteroidota bacterium]
MCGISGIIRMDNGEAGMTDIRRMNDTIRHRGPDGEGFFMEGNLALGHRRLAIIGLGPEGYQPMELADNYVVTYNGEIYNYIEIGKELQAAGYQVSFQSDTEILLKAYDHWGVNCLQHFNGMWSFALYDRRNRILFCSRDRFGVKPFYYTTRNNLFLFGSEIKQLLAVTGHSRVNRRVLLDYLVTGFEDHREDCFFDGISKLPASHYLLYDLENHSFRIEKYYQLEGNDFSLSHKQEDKLSAFSFLLGDAVRLRLRSDVKVGTCLSGGLDSSAIASLAAGLYRAANIDPFTAIHARSVEKDTDESPFAAEVAGRSGMNLMITEPSYGELISECDRIIGVLEEPFGSPSILMQSYVMQAAGANKIKVLLDGQGGDELLLGYERYFTSYLKQFPLGQKLKAFRQLSRHSRLSLRELLLYYMYFSIPSIREKRLRDRFSFLSNSALQDVDFDLLKEVNMTGKDIRQMQVQEITRFQLPHLLKYEDRNSMSFSVEARLPFLDYRLVEFCLSLDTGLKISKGWSKYILRKSMEGRLPDSIVWRKNKFGFEAPKKWLNNNNLQFTTSIQESEILAKLIRVKPQHFDDPAVLWRLFNIARWEKIFSVRSDG